MKLRLLLLPVLSLFSTGCGMTLFHASENYREEANWADYSRVKARTINGDISIAPGAGPGIVVEGRLHAGGITLAEAQSNLEALQVRVAPDEADPRILAIDFVYPEELRNRNIGADLVIHAPESCAVDLNTGNGTVVASDILGPSTMRTSNGNVKATRVNGPLVISTSNGSIESETVDGALEARTSNGNVIARSITGDCKLISSNGRIQAMAVVGGVSADTSNGGIVVQAAPSHGANFDLDTSNGSIRVTIPANLSLDLDLAASNGRVLTELGDAPITQLHMSRQSLAGKLNGGGAGKLYARTSNGSVTLTCAESVAH